MWLEWGLTDGWRVALITLAAVFSALLAARFVYRGAPPALWILRALILALWWAGVISLALVVRREEPVRPERVAYVDVSESMQTRDETLDGSPAARADAAGRIAQSLGEQGYTDVSFAVDLAARNRGSTLLAPILQDALRRGLASEGRIRAVVVSDGGAADEPALGPLLSALAQQGVAVDVAPLGREPDPAHRVGLSLIGDPPAMMVSGETTWVELALTGSAGRLTITQGGRELSRIENIEPGRARVAVMPDRAGRHPFEFVASIGERSASPNDPGSGAARAGFQALVLPPMTVGFAGPLSWDALMLNRAIAAAPGIRARGFGPASERRAAAQMTVVTGTPARRSDGRNDGASDNIPHNKPVTFWPQEQMKGESHGIRWVGFEPGPHAVSRSGSQRPLAARHTLVLDPTWTVKERYPDGVPLIAVREHATAPAYLVNGVGLWRWGFDASVLGQRSTELERRVDAWLEWCRLQIWPDADVYPSRAQVASGEPVELFAVFKKIPERPVVFEIVQPDGSVVSRPAPSARLVRSVFIPKSDGAHAVRVAGLPGVESGFMARTVDYDRIYPYANRDLLLKIAQATGGAVRSIDELLRPGNAAADADERILRTRRYKLARHPLSFVLVMLLLSGLWLLESRWFR